MNLKTAILFRIVTHLCAAGLGALIVTMLMDSSSVETKSETPLQDFGREAKESRSVRVVHPSESMNDELRIDQDPPLEPPMIGLVSNLETAELSGWLNELEDYPEAYAEAQVTLGILGRDPDLIRAGILGDPNNPHLLFIGASEPAFSNEERREFSKRIFEQDPDNALAGYLYAASLLDAGDRDAAVEVMRDATQRHGIEDYSTSTMMLMEDVYLAAGLSPVNAKINGTFNHTAPYLRDVRELAQSLVDMAADMPTETANELRGHAALMGLRVSQESSEGPLINRLIGLGIEDLVLGGLPATAPSPYVGLSVEEARNALLAERDAINEVVGKAPSGEEIFAVDRALLSRYIDRLRLLGELEAMKWLIQETGD